MLFRSGNYSISTADETGYEKVSQPGTISDLSGVAGTTTRNLVTRINNLVISGSVIDDVNNDGADTGETTTTASPTVTLYLDNPSTGTVGSRDAGDTTVGSPGAATFSWSGLSSGTYFLVETDPANYTSPRTTITTGAGGTITKTSSNELKIVITSSSSTGLKFLDTWSYSIAGTVWDDLNGDASSSGESGKSGVTVTLYTDAGTVGTFDASDTVLTTATSGADGTYSFTGRTYGNYLLRVTEIGRAHV